MINRDLFKKYMQNIKDTMNREDEIYECGNKIFEDFCGLFLSKEISIMIDMLSCLMDLKIDAYHDNDIEYFIYQLNWGTEECAKNCIVVGDKTYPLTNFDELYDFILRGKENEL